MPDAPHRPHLAKYPRIALTWPILFIGVEKVLKGLALVALGVSLLVLDNQGLADTIASWAHFFHIAPGNRLLQELLAKLLNLPRPTVRNLVLVAFLYATLYFVEGIGLLLRQHWAEWLVVIATATLIPVEIYEVIFHFGWVKLLVFFVNIAILLYLIYLLRRQRAARLAAIKNSPAT